MVSVKNEINDILLNTVSDLESRLDESRNVLSDIQTKMDSKVSEAKGYKVSVDDSKENIKRLEDEIKSLESDLIELKEKYGKKNLVAVIEAGTKEINLEIKKKQDEIQIHKNKIAELTNRARSIKDLLLNLKKDKKIKEEKLKDLEDCTNYYKVRLEEIVKYTEDHEDLSDYFVNEPETIDSVNVFEDIVGTLENVENVNSEITESVFDEVSIAEADEVFNDVINPVDEDIEENTEIKDEDQNLENEENVYEVNEEALLEENKDNFQGNEEFNVLVNDEDSKDDKKLEDTHDLEIKDLLSSVNEKSEDKRLENINKAIDDEFANIFGKNINEPIKTTMDIFGNEFVENQDSEADIVNKLTNLGLDYYSFTEDDRNLIKENFNEQTISEIINILKTNKIQLDNVYVDAKILSSIAPAELSDIIDKLLKAGQSADTIGYVLDKLPLVDVKLMETTINNYGDYIKNVDVTDIIIKSLKGDN